MRHLPLLLVALSGLLAASAGGAAPPVSEATVKAAFVYNFTKFVEWPPEAFPAPASPIRLCVLGKLDPFLAELATVEGKAAQNRIIRMQKVSKPEEIRGCHLLVVGESENPQLVTALRSAQTTGALTVSEINNFTDAGGAIGLVVANERVQFEINLEAATQANLRLSSQLLKLARRVKR